MFFLGAYSYIADISTPEYRTFRLAMMDGLFHIGFYAGNGLAGPVKKHLGLPYNFALGMLFAVIAAAYVLLRIKESHIPQRNPERTRMYKLRMYQFLYLFIYYPPPPPPKHHAHTMILVYDYSCYLEYD